MYLHLILVLKKGYYVYQAINTAIEQARALAERFPNDPQYRLVKEAFKQEWAFRQETASALDQSFESLHDKMSEDEQEPTDVQKAILSRIQQDQEWTTTLNKEIKRINDEAKQASQNGSSYMQERPSYPVTTNKLCDILNGTHDFVEQPAFLTWLGNITSGNFEWPNYRYHTTESEVTILGDTESNTIYGNSRATYLKTVLLNTHIQYGNFDKMPVNSINYYIAPLPKQLLTACDPTFTTSYTYYYNKPNVQGLFIPYNAYAFGGRRQLPEYNKPFGPEDCSSWVIKLSCSGDLPTKLSTRDFFLAARGTQNDFGLHNELVNIQDPQQDITPGLVMSRHRFKADDHEHNNPVGGHTALVLDVQGKEIITLGYNRDMPTKEGFGIENFLIEPNPQQEFFFFSPKKITPANQALETVLKP